MLKLLEVYDPVRTTTKKKIVLVSGRNAGKSVNISILAVTNSLITDENYDSAICRSTSSAINTGIKLEIKKVVNSLDAWYAARVNVPEAKHEITFTHNNNKIKFMGVGEDKASSDRTRGYTTEKPLRYIIMEEAQQMTKESFYDALFTLRRNLAPDGQEIYLLNPEPNPEHWLNVEVDKWRDDPDYLVIDSTYLDIIDFIKDEERKDIEKLKEIDPQFYEWKYLGKVTGLYSKLAFPHFDRESHVVPIETWREIAQAQPIALVIGVDNATMRDKTGFVPIIVDQDDVRWVLEPFYYDPKAFKPMSNSEFAEMAIEYLSFLFERYGLANFYSEPADIVKRALPIVFTIDCAAIGSDLSIMLSQKLLASNYSTICWAQRFKNKHIIANNNVVNTLFRNNKVFILNSNQYYCPLKKGLVQGENGRNIIVKQLNSVIWNDRHTGYETSIPNDICDAFVYGVNETVQGMNDILTKRII